MINDKCGGCRVGQRREVQGLIPKGFGSSNLPLRIRDSQIKEHERARPDEGAAKERGGDSDES